MKNLFHLLGAWVIYLLMTGKLPAFLLGVCIGFILAVLIT